MNYETYKKKLIRQMYVLLDFAPYGTDEQTIAIYEEVTRIRLQIKQIEEYPDTKQTVPMFTATIESKLNNEKL